MVAWQSHCWSKINLSRVLLYSFTTLASIVLGLANELGGLSFAIDWLAALGVLDAVGTQASEPSTRLKRVSNGPKNGRADWLDWPSAHRHKYVLDWHSSCDMAGEFPFEGTGTRRARVGCPLGFVDNNVETGVANLLRLSPVKPPYTRWGDN